VTILERTVNGQPGLVSQLDGVTVTVYAFDIADDKITHIWTILNPGQAPALDDGLARVSMPSGPLPAADAWGQQHARHRDPPLRRRRRRCHRRAPRSRRWRLRPVRAVSAG
jgi:RNA polymerase sigma-70 factor (ECF subfamily)